MNKVIYSGNAIVELQGEEALNLISLENGNAQYEIIGFDEKQIFVRDFRMESIKSLRNFLDTGDPTNFHLKFNSLAWVEIKISPNGKINVELKDPTHRSADMILWIAIGINEKIPAHDYIVLESEAISKDEFALFTLFHYPSKFLETTQNLFRSYAEIE